MRILYVFPHPDDESFGPAPAMSIQRRQGHEVTLLTLTRGGATRQRHRYGYSVEKMGEIRLQEMQNVAEVLDLTELKVLDLPDSGLKHMDPREIEAVILEEIDRIRPHVLVGYAVHGVSGFHDHLVGHAVVKSAFVQARESVPELQRLALFSIPEEEAKKANKGGPFHLSGTPPDEYGCIVEVEQEDVLRTHRALDCYVTFQETIKATGIKDKIGLQVLFELFQEEHPAPLTDLFAGLS